MEPRRFASSSTIAPFSLQSPSAFRPVRTSNSLLWGVKTAGTLSLRRLLAECLEGVGVDDERQLTCLCLLDELERRLLRLLVEAEPGAEGDGVDLVEEWFQLWEVLRCEPLSLELDDYHAGGDGGDSVRCRLGDSSVDEVDSSRVCTHACERGCAVIGLAPADDEQPPEHPLVALRVAPPVDE